MKKYFKYAYLLTVYSFFYLPIVILIIYSFNNASFSAQWHGFTLGWYHQLFADKNLFRIVLHSVTIGTVAASFSTLLGSLIAMALYRYHFRMKPGLYFLIFMLIILPDIVLAIALLMLFYFSKIPLGFWTLLGAHITFCLPFVVLTLLGRYSQFDENLFEAAKDLGASELTLFYRILLPMLLPALIAAWLLSFTLSFDDVIISFFVTGPNFQVLPLYLYSIVKLGVKPEINALCTILFAATLSLVFCAQIAWKKR